MAIYGYLRVSTEKQETDNQKLAILSYAQENNKTVDVFISGKYSTRKTTKERRIDELLVELNSGDTLIVSELSRLGRSTGEVIQIIDALNKTGVSFIAIKQNINVSGNGSQNMQSKIMITMFSLFADLERDLISERTKMGLAKAKSEGRLLGRRKGTRSSKLDKYQMEIQELYKSGVNQASLARRYKVTPATMQHFLRTRDLK